MVFGLFVLCPWAVVVCAAFNLMPHQCRCLYITMKGMIKSCFSLIPIPCYCSLFSHLDSLSIYLVKDSFLYILLLLILCVSVKGIVSNIGSMYCLNDYMMN